MIVLCYEVTTSSCKPSLALSPHTFTITCPRPGYVHNTHRWYKSLRLNLLLCPAQLQSYTPTTMAILHGHPRLEVYVECDGVKLPEFDNDEHERSSTTITKYIQTKSDAEFAVRMVLRRPFPRYAMTVKVYIDGKPVGSRIIGDIQYRRARRGSIKRGFDSMAVKIHDGQRTLRKFCFSELQIGEKLAVG